MDDDLDEDAVGVLRVRAKALLRKRMGALRMALSEAAAAERASRLTARLLRHPALADAETVALFDPILAKREIDLRPVDEALRADGRRVAYPSIDPETNVMTFRLVDERSSLKLHPFGYREPALDAAEAAPDVIVVPALAVDGSGNRLGYGGGYYDGALRRFAPPAWAIAVLYDFQLLAEVPVGLGDVPVHAVVTDTRTLDIRGTADALLRERPLGGAP